MPATAKRLRDGSIITSAALLDGLMEADGHTSTVAKQETQKSEPQRRVLPLAPLYNRGGMRPRNESGSLTFGPDFDTNRRDVSAMTPRYVGQHQVVPVRGIGSGWRKYGEKTLKGGSPVIRRSYYKCSKPGCQAQIQIEKWADEEDSAATRNVTSRGDHNHPEEPMLIASVVGVVRTPHPIPSIDLSFADVMLRNFPCMVTANPHAPDCPINYASPGFADMSGYSNAEITGRNCRFLQGPQTNRAAVRLVAQSLQNLMEVHVVILNYTKSGEKFWNLLHVTPMIDSNGKVLCFYGAQRDVTQEVIAGNRLPTLLGDGMSLWVPPGT